MVTNGVCYPFDGIIDVWISHQPLGLFNSVFCKKVGKRELKPLVDE
ncbi:MAG: hypothetical protein V1799_15845 [bacterium]